MKKQEGKSVAEIVTDAIIAQLEKGVCPWQKTWQSGIKNAISKKEYQGINRLITSIVMKAEGYSTPYFATYKQIQDMGGHVKKGSRGTPIIFWKLVRSNKTNEDTENMVEVTEKSFPLMRYYTVFCIEQTEGINLSQFQPQTIPNDPIEEAEKVIQNWQDKPVIKFTGVQPCYIPSLDEIQCPPIENFISSENYYSVIFHEMSHSTGHQSRLAREEVMNSNFFNASSSYALEELVAELGASFLCSHCNIDRVINNSASYIQSWLRVLKDDRKMLITASARSEKAMNYILQGGKGNGNQSL